MINIKTLFAAIGILLVLFVLTWFGFEKILLYAKISTPIPKNWVAVHLVGGDTYYGKINGLAGKTLSLSSPYFLEKMTKAEVANGQNSATSTSFKFNGSANTAEQKYILVEKDKDMWINRANILFIQEVSQNEEVSKYLR